MRSTSRTAALAAFLCLGATAVWAKPACNTADEISAVKLRQMQIQAMVSTLRCDNSTYDFRGRYGAFMEHLNPLLSDNAKRLKSMLARQGNGNIDRYLTGMSNDVQIQSQGDPQYCGKSVQMIEQVATLDQKDIPSFAAQTVTSPYQVVTCPEAPPKPAKKSKTKSKPKATASAE